MPAQRSVPAAPAPMIGTGGRRASRVAGAALVTIAAACASAPDAYVVASETAPDAAHVALVRLVPCAEHWCQSLWIGTTAASATRVAMLPPDTERCDEIAWSRDGTRAAFLIDGYQLRVYDARTNAPAGLMDLQPRDATPTTRIARGITFSDNGAAITFDDCPRDRSGCRPGLMALSR